MAILAILLFAGAPVTAEASTLPGARVPPFRGGSVNPKNGMPFRSVTGPRMTDEELRALLTRHGFTQIEAWIAIIRRESGGYPRAFVNTDGLSDAELHAFWKKPPSFRLDPRGEIAIGLFQINTFANPKYGVGFAALEALSDPDTNASYAREIALASKRGPFGPWSG